MDYTIQRVKDQIIKEIQKSIERSVEDGAFALETMPEIMLEIPREASFGDFATNAAMQLPKQAKKPPKVIAEAIVKNFDNKAAGVEKCEIAGPGFINFTLQPEWVYGIVEDVIDKKNEYGKSDYGKGKTVNVEYISANPTGPMHMGNARGGAIGDTISALFDWAGYRATKEFYINDAGNQIEKFAVSLEARYLQENGQDVTFPEDGYQGEDITLRAKEFIEREGDRYVKAESQERKEALVNYALAKNIEAIRKDLADYGVVYDVWFHESSLYENDQVREAVDRLKERGHTYEKEGALWFKATEFGCEKDDVLIRQNGVPTYFTADIAYHYNKFVTREFDHGINVWGADHHGHVARMKAALEALGIDPKRLDVILMQLVRLMRDGETARMSKRKGNAVTLSDLVEEVGKDAARFFFNLRSPESHFDFDLDLAVEQSNDNPVFYVQYAHARISSILRQGGEE
ncbi:MAG TPA: arginine--tRNA ligase, partial [Eubacteriaceae bacterium]|nr:arginine--tRNA ligase [Eubacteriaceae bacterium]